MGSLLSLRNADAIIVQVILIVKKKNYFATTFKHISQQHQYRYAVAYR